MEVLTDDSDWKSMLEDERVLLWSERFDAKNGNKESDGFVSSIICMINELNVLQNELGKDVLLRSLGQSSILMSKACLITTSLLWVAFAPEPDSEDVFWLKTAMYGCATLGKYAKRISIYQCLNIAVGNSLQFRSSPHHKGIRWCHYLMKGKINIIIK